jgi:DDE family transposase
LALVPDRVPHLAMDTIRCGGWEIITLGVVWHGRVLPVAWEVLPYPLPKGRFTPTVVQLLWRVGKLWPTDRRPHLVADRGFPSLALFAALEQLGWTWTIRLRVTLTVGVDGEARALWDLVQAATPGAWTCQPITYGTGRQRIAGHLVIGRGDTLAVIPAHQANPGSLRHRARQWLLREREVRGKHPGRPARTAQVTDRWVLLFTSHTTARAAQTSYRRRWATEASYRDAQSGYDGQHGWDLEPTLTREADPQVVDHILGLWALGCLIQTSLGDQVGRSTVPSLVQDVRARWTTTGRLSVWMRGRFAFTDLSGDLHDWLLATLTDGAQHLKALLASPPAHPCPHPRPRSLAQAA